MLERMPVLDSVHVVDVEDYSDGVVSIDEITDVFPNVRRLSMYLGMFGRLHIPRDTVLPDLEYLSALICGREALDLSTISPNLHTFHMTGNEYEELEVSLPDAMDVLKLWGTAVTRGKYIDRVMFSGNTGASLECQRINVLCLCEYSRGTIKNCSVEELVLSSRWEDSRIEFVNSTVKSVTLKGVKTHRISLDPRECSIIKGHTILPLENIDDLILVDTYDSPEGVSLFVRNPCGIIQCNFPVKRLHLCRYSESCVQVEAQETLFHVCSTCQKSC